MTIILENTLVEMCKPGDDVMVSGILLQRWKSHPLMPGSRPLIELALLANNVEVLNKREFSKGNQISGERVEEFKHFWKKHKRTPLQAKETLVKSVCPGLFSRHEAKLGLLLTMIGGVAQVTD